MHEPVCSTKFSPKQAVITSLKIGDCSSRLLNDQYACGNIPGVEVIFKISFDPSAGDIREINSSAAKPADTMSSFQKIPYDFQVVVAFIEMIIWKSSSQQALL